MKSEQWIRDLLEEKRKQREKFFDIKRFNDTEVNDLTTEIRLLLDVLED